MSLESTDFKLVLQFITGEVNDVCRLCLVPIANRTVMLDDTISIKTNYFTSVITYDEIFKELDVNMDSNLPKSFCQSCATTSTHAYLFKRLSKYSNDKLKDLMFKIDSILSLTDALSENMMKTAYLIVNQNIVFSSRKHTKKESALKKLKSILKYKTNYTSKKKSKSQIICEECGEIFQSRSHLNTHHARVHSHTRYPCQQCPKILLSQTQLKNHFERTHSPKKIKCPKCDKMFASKALLTYHNNTYHKAVICKLCFVQLPSKKELRRHMNKHDIHTCSKCNKTFMNKQTFNNHTKTCGVADPKKPKYICDICDKRYVQKSGLRSHMRIDHGFGSNMLHCKWCNKKFDAVSKLKNHSVKHTRERNFNCEQCGNKFVTQAALIYHTRLHTGEKPYPCDLCNESFLSTSRRMEHKHRKHFGPSKECSVCHSKFVSGNQLKNHYRRHFNPQSKLYVPDIKDESKLHTGEKLLPRDLCSESFLSPSRRMKPKQKKPFTPSKECSVCHSKFDMDYQLKRHYQRHFNPQSNLYVPDIKD